MEQNEGLKMLTGKLLQVNYKQSLKQAIIISPLLFPTTYINYKGITVPKESF